MVDGYYLEAEYETGYVHSNELYDVSPYALNDRGELGPNIFNDILQKRPNAIHGKMVRFSLIGPEKRYDINWMGLPDNARPIYLRHMEHVFNPSTGEKKTNMTSQSFGYQYNDEDGSNHKEVQEID